MHGPEPAHRLCSTPQVNRMCGCTRRGETGVTTSSNSRAPSRSMTACPAAHAFTAPITVSVTRYVVPSRTTEMLA